MGTAAERGARRYTRLNSVRNRLLVLFFAITSAAVGFVYLYVVPQLRSSLTGEKLQRLESFALEDKHRLTSAMRNGASQAKLRQLARELAQRSQARVTILGLRGSRTGPSRTFVLVDSGLGRAAVAPSYVAAATAASTGTLTSAVELVGGGRVGETAIPLTAGPRGRPRWVAVLSTPLGDVEDNVALIQRQILIAGAIALTAALLAGWFVARAHARRLSRLERAAEEVARGNFSVPIPVDPPDEVGQLGMAFNEMQQRLARLDSARKEFIANASHELRTPIFSLAGFVELLEHEEPDAATRDEFVTTMREQVQRLTRLTAELLDLSRLDADAMELRVEPVRLDSVAGETVDEFGPLADLHGSRIEVRTEGDSTTALADRDRVAQIIRILVDNALTHTPEGTGITLTAKGQDGTAEFVVSDNGPGISPQSRGRVFERFFTGDSASGSGLGLAIARELAQRMRGDLDVASHRGRTDFTLVLPAAHPRGGGPR
jgi:signal transduction histidine kinase